MVLVAGCGGGGEGDPDARIVSDAGPMPDAPPPAGKRGELVVLEVKGTWSDGDGNFTPYEASRLGGGVWNGARPIAHKESMRDGACVLLTYTPQQCDEWCDGVCVGLNQCQPWPAYVSAGTLTITGLWQTLTLQPDPDFHGYGYSTQPPLDMFVAGAEITASAAGATMPAFSVTAHGVEPLESPLAEGAITLEPGKDHTIRWTAGGGDARVKITINADNQGHGQPYKAIIECDVPDAGGQVTIPKAMVDAFPETHAWSACAGSDCPPSRIVRYTRGVALVPDGHVELIVGSEITFGVEHMP
jgi:hypothetical protein